MARPGFGSAVLGSIAPEEKGGSGSQTVLPEGEGSGQYMYLPEGGGAALPCPVPGRCHRHGPASCGGFRCSHKRSDGAWCLALPVRAGTGAAHRVPPDRGRPTEPIAGAAVPVTLSPRAAVGLAEEGHAPLLPVGQNLSWGAVRPFLLSGFRHHRTGQAFRRRTTNPKPPCGALLAYLHGRDGECSSGTRSLRLLPTGGDGGGARRRL